MSGSGSVVVETRGERDEGRERRGERETWGEGDEGRKRRGERETCGPSKGGRPGMSGMSACLVLCGESLIYFREKN